MSLLYLVEQQQQQDVYERCGLSDDVVQPTLVFSVCLKERLQPRSTLYYQLLSCKQWVPTNKEDRPQKGHTRVATHHVQSAARTTLCVCFTS